MFENLTPLTDSRSLTDPSGSLFFALRTATGDGHRFIPALYRNGVRNFVVEGTDTYPVDTLREFPGANFLRTPSPLATLQEMAAARRASFPITTIGITGSRGKTMVKEWLGELLAPDWKICRSPRSYNSQIGVPLSVWQLSPGDTLGIFEAGISRRGEMQALARIIAPTIAVITNIGNEHDEGFISRQEKIAEKLQLAAGASTIIYSADDPMLAAMAREFYPAKRHLRWSFNPSTEAEIHLASQTMSHDSSSLSWETADGSSATTLLSFTSPWEIENVATVLSVMISLGYPAEEIARRISKLQPAATRLQVSAGINDSMIIHDDYTCDLPSLSIALDLACRRLPGRNRITAIISDIDPGNETLEETYMKAGQLFRRWNVTRVFGIGPEISRYFALIDIPGETYPDTESFIREANPVVFNHEMILVKGAPEYGFDRIVSRLEAKTHETLLEVNLDAMISNYRFYRSHLRPTTGIVAMVKASGYGAGARELALTLQSQGAAYLAVAVGDEGAELRRAGVTMPIMVLNPMVLNYTQLFDNRLEPEIFSFESLDAIIREARRAGITGYPIHIKIDSGMHRLGFREEDIPRLLEKLDSQLEVKAMSVFSHLATADCLDQDDYTLGQLEYFSRCSEKIVSHFPYKVLRHILNTAGILRFPQYQFDMVRLGIGLYGIPVINDGSEEPLRPISSLRSVIIALHDWDSTETIGYGRRGELHRPSRVATVPIGYADGFNRHCGRGNWKVEINGHLCPTLGNICMDLCMVDVTDVEGVSIGDPVVIFGPKNPVTEMAELLDTIPYECLTSVSPRVRRVYYRES